MLCAFRIPPLYLQSHRKHTSKTSGITRHITMALSKRSQKIQPFSNFLRLYVEGRQLGPHPDFPYGFINLCISENALSIAQVGEQLAKMQPTPPSHLNYTIMCGSLDTREIFASFISKWITCIPIDASQVAILNGAGCVIDALTTAICDPGDKIMTQGPGYRGFMDDVKDRSSAELVIVRMDEDPDVDPKFSVAAFEKAWVEEGGNESRIKAVLLSSPVNPTGEVLSEDTIREIVQWTREKGIHIIFSEVYALSVHDPNVKFVSVAQALNGDMRDDVHIVWSLSKDFCVSGLRVGVLITKNTKIIRMVERLGVFWSTSRHTQWATSRALSDDAWVDMYVRQNREKIRESYVYCTSVLNELNVPFMRAEAGFFVWIDLRKWITAQTQEEETRLLEKMAEARFLLSPATELFSSHIGFFRLCYASADTPVLKEAMKRFTKFIDNISSEQHHS